MDDNFYAKRNSKKSINNSLIVENLSNQDSSNQSLEYCSNSEQSYKSLDEKENKSKTQSRYDLHLDNLEDLIKIESDIKTSKSSGSYRSNQRDN